MYVRHGGASRLALVPQLQLCVTDNNGLILWIRICRKSNLRLKLRCVVSAASNPLFDLGKSKTPATHVSPLESSILEVRIREFPSACVVLRIFRTK